MKQGLVPHLLRRMFPVLLLLLAASCDPKIKIDKEVVAQADPQRDWLMLGRNAEHQHFSTTDIEPPLTKFWDRGVKSVVTDHPLALGDRILATTRSGMMYMLDYQTGEPVESGKIGPAMTNVPTIDKSRLYLSFEMGERSILGIDLLRSKRFFDKLYPDISTATAVRDNMLLFGDIHHNLICLNANSGEEIWKFDAGAPVKSSPALSGNKVIFANNKGRVFALDLSSGLALWEKQLLGNVFSHPVLGDGRAFLGTSEGKLVALDLEKGNLIWQRDFDGAIFSSPSYYEDALYIGTNERMVYAVDAARGETQWSFKTEGIVNTVPLPSPNYLYLTAWDRNLYVLDRHSGEMKFKTQLKKPAKSSPIIYRDLLLVHTANDKLIAFSNEQFTLAAKEQK